uniref:Uncharacterized protein n=1 Tax=Rhizophora mucronata TaxID=61149 RepID=A0A2P2QU51_RHIMU
MQRVVAVWLCRGSSWNLERSVDRDRNSRYSAGTCGFDDGGLGPLQ